MRKPRVTPLAFSVAMMRSALFMVATNRARRFSTGVGSRNRCSGRFPAHSLAKVILDHAEIGAGARDQIGDGNALVLGVPLFDGARPPHRGLSPLEAEKAGVERAVSVERRGRRQPPAPAPPAEH